MPSPKSASRRTAATATARLTGLEATLSPTELIVRWLDDAHSYGGAQAYVTALLDEPPERYPLNRLLGEAAAGARATASVRRGPELDGAIRKALRETTFRFDLVMRINTTTHDLVERASLMHVALAGYGSHVASQGRGARPAGAAHNEDVRACLAIADRQVTELMAADEARSIVEARYLAGHPALFPDEVARFEEVLERVQVQTVLTMRLAELDGLPPGDPGNPDAVAHRASELVEDLVEPARSSALEKLDEVREAITIATDWVRRVNARKRDTDLKTSTR